MKKTIRAIGLMSGTSMDGIDLALIETDGQSIVKPLSFISVSYDDGFADEIASALTVAKTMNSRIQRPAPIALLERALTDKHEQAVQAFLNSEGLAADDIDVVGFHGQTVLHRPDLGFTVQLGDGQRLADALGIDVVYDMRANDMVHGGQGAPLVPVYHQALAATLNAQMREGGIGFINIGGISNATFVFEGADPVALDCGPGNALIDQWVQEKAGLRFDDCGASALEGVAYDAVIADYMQAEFFSKIGPKSLDRNDFTLGPVAGLSLNDGAATLAKLAALCIAKSVGDLPQVPKTLVLSGGGAKNAAIIAYLREALGSSIKVTTADQLGFNGDMMEAEAWAYLAVRSLKGLALTYPSTTGCNEPVSGGVVARAKK